MRHDGGANAASMGVRVNHDPPQRRVSRIESERPGDPAVDDAEHVPVGHRREENLVVPTFVRRKERRAIAVEELQAISQIAGSVVPECDWHRRAVGWGRREGTRFHAYYSP